MLLYNYEKFTFSFTCLTHLIYSVQASNDVCLHCEYKYKGRIQIQHSCDHCLLNINATTLRCMASSVTASDSETSGRHPSTLKELFRAYQLSSQETKIVNWQVYTPQYSKHTA